MSPQNLHVGVGRADITPLAGIPVGGWSTGTRHTAEQIEGRLWLSVLAFGDRSGPAGALVDLDLAIITNDQAPVLRQLVGEVLGIPPDAIHVGATHNHAAPVTARLMGGHVRTNAHLVAPYVESFLAQATPAATAARDSFGPVRMGVATGRSPLAVNRRMRWHGRVVVGLNDDGPVDPTVRVARFDRDGVVVATLVHYSAHPIILGPDAATVTPEYPGVVKQVVERAHGGICLFLQGSAGNTGTTELFVQDLEPYRRLGGMLGHEAAATLYRARPGLTAQRPAIDQDPSAWICRFEYEPQAPDDTTVGAISTIVGMPLRADLGDHAALEADAQRLLGDLHEAEDRDLRDAGRISPATRDLTAQTKWAIMLSERRRFVACDDRLDMELHGVRLGPLAVLGAPVEPFVELGLSVEAASPFGATMACGYANGYYFYLPTAAAHAEGGYEPTITPFAPQAANVYVDAQAALLSRLDALG